MWVKRIILFVMVLLIVALTTVFFFRNYFLQKFVREFSDKAKNKYGVVINSKNIDFVGVSGLYIKSFSVVPLNCDTLISSDSIYIKPDFWRLLKGDLKVNELTIYTSNISLIKNKDRNNYSFLFKKKESNATDSNATNYAYFIHKLTSKFFNYVPDRVVLQSITVNYQNDTIKERFNTDKFILTPEAFNGGIHDVNRNLSYSVEGKVDSKNGKLDFRLQKEGKQNITVPILKEKYNAIVMLDNVEFSINENNYADDKLELKGVFKISNLVLNHPRIATNNVRFNKINFNYAIALTNNSLELQNTSSLQVNKINLLPAAKYTNTKNEKEYALKINIPKQSADSLFKSLPEGMFENLEGIETEGFLSYQMNFLLNSGRPDSLTFTSELISENFKILKFGKTNLAKLNQTFEHTVYENGNPMRTVLIGAENPNYYSLTAITPYFKNAVLTSEDGSFFWSKGFNEEAFKKSIAENYKAKRFVRGGSTITMQLVKNVFLTRNKNISRKLEEVLIVWLIENQRLVSKNRMFEVYLNIIELGPNIYGVNEAAKFYFNKNASELTLAESIYMASLLPRPKQFKYFFEKDGSLKSFMVDYYKVVSRFLWRHNLITENEYNDLKPQIKLTGKAKNYLAPMDSTEFEMPVFEGEFGK